MPLHFILMADIVRSREAPAKALLTGFRKIVDGANTRFRTDILSPLTITLGDEFQGVVKSVEAGLRMMVWLEEEKLAAPTPFALRYVFRRGLIETALNRQRAHAMLGPGLTSARAQLEELKRGRRRFWIETQGGARDEALNLAFALYERAYDSWSADDRKLVKSFLRLGDYKKVASRWKRHPSSMFRRQRSLGIEAYLEIKSLIGCLGRLSIPPGSSHSG
jgi:hypothetical protein